MAIKKFKVLPNPRLSWGLSFEEGNAIGSEDSISLISWFCCWDPCKMPVFIIPLETEDAISSKLFMKAVLLFLTKYIFIIFVLSFVFKKGKLYLNSIYNMLVLGNF